MKLVKPLHAAILLPLFLALAIPAAAQVYRWVDKDGKVQYSDQPPPPSALKGEAQRINSSSPPPAAGDAGKKPADPVKDFDKRRKENDEKQQKDSKSADAAKQNDEYCNSLRGHLRLLQDGGRIARTNKDGEREFLEDSAINDEIARVQKNIADKCKS